MTDINECVFCGLGKNDNKWKIIVWENDYTKNYKDPDFYIDLINKILGLSNMDKPNFK